MKVFITGGAGFIGSHAAEYYALRGHHVVIYDNLSRPKLLNRSYGDCDSNLQFLKRYPAVTFIQGDILDLPKLKRHLIGIDLVIHAAAQTAVTTSCKDPLTDFLTNAHGTLNVLEAVCHASKPPTIIFCSTNKVYGANVNQIAFKEKFTRYELNDPAYPQGINEAFGIDHCGHSPYGCSKLSADLYMQDYAHHYGLKIGVFRLSCIYGPQQFGVEEQGWLAWFSVATYTARPIVLYGDGKQVRDVLFISDLLSAFDAFVQKDIGHQVFNLGGGINNTISLIESLDLLSRLTGKTSDLRYENWRPDDQKVYISDIRKASELLGWSPKVSVEEGVGKLVNWIRENEGLFLEHGSYRY